MKKTKQYMKSTKYSPILQIFLNLYQSFGMNQSFEKALRSDETINKISSFFDLDNLCLKKPNKNEKRIRYLVARETCKHKTSGYCFEVVVTIWNKCKKACKIHCHPQFTYYQCISGSFKINTYECIDPKNKVVRKTGTFILKKGESFCSVAKENCYGHAIHDVRSLEKGSIMAHGYSNDASLAPDDYKIQDVSINPT